MSIKKKADYYFQRFSHFNQRYKNDFRQSSQLRVIIVIPCYDEEPDFVLDSLAACALPDLDAVEVMLVFNHSEEAAENIKVKHEHQFRTYRQFSLSNGLKGSSLAALDLPARHAGVGLARKMGLDWALSILAEQGQDGLLVCLDADCKVSPDYLKALIASEKKMDLKCFTLAFSHLAAARSQAQRFIDSYEIWLRYYVLALRWAGFPFAWHTIGSCMGVRASRYAEVGGMNRRKAGEDFYFLHKLFPLGGVYELREAMVYPQARISERVPFGTGRAMGQMQAGDERFDYLYHPHIFKEVKQIHQTINQGGEIMELSFFRDFLLHHKRLAKSYQALVQRGLDSRQFYFWWDGFTILKFVHFRREEYQDLKAEDAASQLLATDSSTALLPQLLELEAKPEAFKFD